MRGYRRARASLALMATANTLPSNWYQFTVPDRYMFQVPERCSHLRTEVLEQGVEGELLLDAEVVVPHDVGEFGVPWGRGRLADEPSKRMRRRHRGLVGLVVVPPRSPVHPVTHRLGDPDAAPVEVAVVAEHRATDREQFQQPPPGGGGLATYANQRLTPCAQFVGGGRDHHRVLAYPHPGGAQRLVMTAELTER